MCELSKHVTHKRRKNTGTIKSQVTHEETMNVHKFFHSLVILIFLPKAIAFCLIDVINYQDLSAC